MNARARIGVLTGLAVVASCGGDRAGGERAPNRVDDVAWDRAIATAVEFARERPVDLLLWFHGDLEGEDGDSSAALLHREVFSPRIPCALHALFVDVDLQYDALQPTAARLRRFAGIAWWNGERVVSMPSVVLADRRGRPYAFGPGYTAGEGVRWVDRAAALQDVRRRRDAAFALAADSEGIERAHALAIGLEAMPEDIVAAFYRDEARAIVALDADGSAGLAPRFTELLQWGEARAIVQRLDGIVSDLLTAKDFRGVHGAVVSIADGHRGNPLVRQWAAAVEVFQDLRAGDLEQARRRLDAAVAMAPQSRIVARIESLQKLMPVLVQRAARSR